MTRTIPCRRKISRVIVVLSTCAVLGSAALGQGASGTSRDAAIAFSADQYVTQLDLANREIDDLKSAWVWRFGLIISLIGASASFGRNSMAIKEFRTSLERHERRLKDHSDVHELHGDEIQALRGLESKVDLVAEAVARIESLESMRSLEGQRSNLGKLIGELIRENQGST